MSGGIKRNWRQILVVLVIALLVLLLWDELQDFGAELYRLFN